MRISRLLLLVLVALAVNGCSVVKYNFTGAGAINGKTFQVNLFQNTSQLVQPGIDRTFTNKLQDLILNQTNLSLTSSGGELVYEGEITDYRISPMAANANDRASQNRMTIAVLVRFSNKNEEKDDLEKRYSFYQDYEGTDLPTGAQLTSLIDAIFDRITQDIFNDTLAKW